MLLIDRMVSPQVAKSIEQHYQKEWVIEMQHKGKLPRYPTEAQERKEANYNRTMQRIFPKAQSGLDMALDKMLENSTKMLDEAAGSVAGASDASYRTKTSTMASTAQRNQLKEKLAQLESELDSHRTARLKAEEDLARLKTSLPGTPASAAKSS